MLKVAGIQFRCNEDREQNIHQALTLAAVAADKGAKIVCFQELFALPWFPRQTNQEYFGLAEDLKGNTVNSLIRFARERQVAVICPIFEKTPEGKFYNTAVLINQEGGIAGHYRKIHIPDFPLWWEKYYFNSGDSGFPVFDLGFIKIGIQICWDVFFPEGFRILALKGAEMVFCPTAAACVTKNRWQKAISGHTVANNFYVMRVNRVGKEEKQSFYGNSFCTDPHGEVIGEAEDSDQSILLCDIDLDEVEKMRRCWPFFPDRHPEKYKELIQKTE
ncbi:MAG: hypothetical protein HZA78_04685 [Candidatus Schekmanbacteria bacterium]|nr:hypothetical protein [Candidatus Schekmanbacteria bacterium]